MEGLFFSKSVMAAALIALVLDALIGDPKWLWRGVRHPVVWIGHLANKLERRLNRGKHLLFKGGIAWLLIVSLCGMIGFLVQGLLLQWTYGWLAVGALGSIGLAARSLDQHVRAVAHALDKSLAAGRKAVSQIVGRDPETLDEAAVCRAAVESLAENASDGVIAPLFWFLLLGLPGLLAYKAINTLDSMWGHRTARFEAFGKAAARLDDAANWLPARLTAVLVSLATGTLFPLFAAFRDGPKHRSPNAGYPEAAFASALGLSLAGPRAYQGVMTADARMGIGTREATQKHIRAALKLFWYLWALAAIICALLTALIWLL